VHPGNMGNYVADCWLDIRSKHRQFHFMRSPLYCVTTADAQEHAIRMRQSMSVASHTICTSKPATAHINPNFRSPTFHSAMRPCHNIVAEPQRPNTTAHQQLIITPVFWHKTDLATGDAAAWFKLNRRTLRDGRSLVGCSGDDEDVVGSEMEG
jgi:hypothetical protein